MKKMSGRKKRLLLCAAAPAVLLLLALLPGLSTELKIVFYTLETEKLKQPVRTVLLTDLHSCAYGEGQRELLDAVAAQSPDLVLLGGDIFDDRMPHDNAQRTVSALAADYPCYYVSGNHEFRSGEVQAIKEMVAAAGAVVLEGGGVTLQLHDQAIGLCGVDDPAYIGAAAMEAQLSEAAEQTDFSRFSILLAHRPELVETYTAYPFDLVLSGHAHGGQWRIPGILNGLLAPNQGLFPKYAGGEYDLDGTTLLVSRGLARESTLVPRIYNRPELVVVDLVPEKP